MSHPNSNSRRPDGRCRAGLHEWVPANIYTSPEGKNSCKKCRSKQKRKALERLRKFPIVEPEVTAITRRADRNTGRAHVPRDFWNRLIERVALLEPHEEELRVEFPDGCAYQPDDSSVRWAAGKAGVDIGTEWRLDHRCLYVWLVRGKKARAAA